MLVAALAVQGQVGVDLLARFAGLQPHERALAAPAVWTVPDHPFFRAGEQPDGTWSAVRMLEAWRAAGLSPEEAASVVVFMHEHWLPSVSSAAHAAREAPARRKAEVLLSTTFPDAWARLDAIRPTTPLPGFEWTLDERSPEASADHPAWLGVLGEVGVLVPTLTDAPLGPADLTVARTQVVRAVEAAGLKQLNVPLGVWDDPIRLADLAAGLRLANGDLQAITGWEGGVLGLDGRLTLTPGVIDHALVDGRAPDGRRLEMETDWQDLAHEWMHALDFALARRSLAHPRFGTLTDHRTGWLRHWRPSPTATAWWAAVDRVETAGAGWVARREQAVAQHALARRRDLQGYWTDPAELLAFAWEARVRRLDGLALLGAPSFEADPQDLLAPRAQELAAMEPAWAPLLEEARQALGFDRAAPARAWEQAP